MGVMASSRGFDAACGCGCGCGCGWPCDAVVGGADGFAGLSELSAALEPGGGAWPAGGFTCGDGCCDIGGDVVDASDFDGCGGGG